MSPRSSGCKALAEEREAKCTYFKFCVPQKKGNAPKERGVSPQAVPTYPTWMSSFNFVAFLSSMPLIGKESKCDLEAGATTPRCP